MRIRLLPVAGPTVSSPRPALLSSAAVALAASCVAALPAAAQEVDLGASIYGEVTATDRAGGTTTQTTAQGVRRTTGGDNDGDLVSSAGGSLRASVAGARTQAGATYTGSYDRYLSDSDRSGYRQTFAGLGTFEAIEDHLTLSARASLAQTFRGLGDSAATARSGTGSGTQTLAWSAGPTWTQRLGDIADLSATYRLSGTYFFDADSGADDDVARPNDALRHELTVGLRSGDDFDRLRWGVTGRYTLEGDQGNSRVTTVGGVTSPATDDDDSQSTRSVTGNAEYRITRQIGVLGTVGYDDIDLNSRASGAETSDDVSGLFWSTGLRWNPSPRTDFSLEYGRRYNGDFWTGSAAWQPTARTSVRGSVSTTFTTQQEQIIQDLERRILLDSPFGLLVCDPVLLICGPIDEFAEVVDSTFRSQRVQIGVSHELERMTLDATAVYQTRDFSRTGETDTTYGVTFSADRQLRPETSAVASVGYAHSTSSGATDPRAALISSDETTVISFRLTLSHEFANDLTGSVGYSHQHRISDEADTESENAVVARITKSF